MGRRARTRRRHRGGRQAQGDLDRPPRQHSCSRGTQGRSAPRVSACARVYREPAAEVSQRARNCRTRGQPATQARGSGCGRLVAGCRGKARSSDRGVFLRTSEREQPMIIKRSALVLAALVVANACLAVCARAAGTVVLRDDFNGASLNSSVWGVGNWKLGRTQLGSTPVVTGGIARLPFTNYRLTGCEIYTNQNFALGNGVEFEARVRMTGLPKGLVSAMFSYNTAGSLSDEIDIEILSKQVAGSTGGAPVLF